jgi:translation initiation factor 2-alpha kinase 4
MTNLLQETKSDYNNQKLNTFNNDLNNHLTNFKTMINNSKPPNEIDFTEKNDEPVDKLDMEELIKQMEKERNNVNNTIFNNSNKIDSSYNIQDKNTDFNTDILNNNVLNDEIIDIIPTIINDENNSNNNNNNNSNSIKITKIDDIESILNIENVNFVTDNNLSNNNLSNNNLSNNNLSNNNLSNNNLSNNNLSNNNLSNNNLSNNDLNEKLNLIIKKLDLLEDLILKNFKQ